MLDKLIIGTVQFGLDYGITNQTGKVSEEDLDKIFSFCNENNINYFDTAQDYGSSENIISKYCALYPNFKIITKAKFQDTKLKDTKLEDINKKIQISLDKFTTIECFMLHSFGDYINNEILDQLLIYKKEGIIKKIGVSVYNVDEAILLLKENKIDIIQLPFNYLDDQWFNSEFHNLLKRNQNFEIHVRSIFLQGILLNPILRIPKNILIEDFIKLNAIIDELCKIFMLSRLELCFAYINSFRWIDKFLIGIDNYNHLLLNYNIMNKDLKLTMSQILLIHDKIKSINKLIHKPIQWIF
jgi:aryl-alcohol dehydrogenase-like predicted oxidoreductase